MARRRWINNNILELHVTGPAIISIVVTLTLVPIFIMMTFLLMEAALKDETVRGNIGDYLAILGIISGPTIIAVNNVFKLWMDEREFTLQDKRRDEKTKDDILRKKHGLRPKDE